MVNPLLGFDPGDRATWGGLQVTGKGSGDTVANRFKGLSDYLVQFMMANAGSPGARMILVVAASQEGGTYGFIRKNNLRFYVAIPSDFTGSTTTYNLYTWPAAFSTTMPLSWREGFTPEPSLDVAKYPHRCGCGAPAYVGWQRIECSKPDCGGKLLGAVYKGM